MSSFKEMKEQLVDQLVKFSTGHPDLIICFAHTSAEPDDGVINFLLYARGKDESSKRISDPEWRGWYLNVLPKEPGNPNSIMVFVLSETGAGGAQTTAHPLDVSIINDEVGEMVYNYLLYGIMPVEALS